MAAYSIASVKQKINHLLDSKTYIPYYLPTRDIKCFYNDLLDLELVICQHRSKNLRAVVLEQEIEDVVDNFEDLIGSSFSSFEKLLDATLDMTYLKGKLKKGEYKIEGELPPTHFLSYDDDILFGRYNSILGRSPEPVGLYYEIIHLVYKVLRGSSQLKVTVVCGMAGSGKTTLVKGAYGLIREDFGIHCMFTIPLSFPLRETLVFLLKSLGFHFDDESRKTMGVDELGISLTNILKGKKYLCVLDNLWDSYVWDQLIKFFPDEGNGSRIVCPLRDTTIMNNIVVPFEIYFKKLLGDNDSWELLRNVAFPNEQLNNPQLEEIGKKIAKKCEGLPLAIMYMGKLLRESEKTIERWEEVLEDDDPFQIKRCDGQLISKSLYLSYDPLPYHLKLCFLYMGVLPKDYDIKYSELIMLWIAEGLIIPHSGESLEDTGGRYLLEIRQRSMVLSSQINSSNHGKIIKNFQVHFIFRSLCVREAQNENFFLVIKKYNQIFSEGKNWQRRLCIHNNIILGFKEVHNCIESKPCVSTILYCSPRHQYPLQVYLNFKDLKVLYALTIRFYEFPFEVLELFRLRYLAITYDGQLPKSISKLWKLEFLILGREHIIKSSDNPSYFPVEIWNLQWLKHIQCIGVDLPDPNCTEDILENLLELSGVSARSCTPKILSRMRNLKKLIVHLELIEDELEDFNFFNHVAKKLRRLDSFKCFVLRVFNSHLVVPPTLIFPSTITRLSLSGGGFPWKYMNAICVLPYLSKLKLQEYAFCGPVWEVCGGFPQLWELTMKDLNIEEWRVEPQCFPKLFRLNIHHCYNLQEIPVAFGNLPTFGLMYLYGNNVSLEKSARKIHRDDKFELHISKLGGRDACLALPGVDLITTTMIDE